MLLFIQNVKAIVFLNSEKFMF